MIDVELAIAASLTDSDSMRKLVALGVSRDMFADARCAEAWGFALAYMRDFGSMESAPSDDVMRERFDWYGQLVDGVEVAATAPFLAEELRRRYVRRRVESSLNAVLPDLPDDPLSVARAISDAMSETLRTADVGASTVEYGRDIAMQEQMERDDDMTGSVPYPVAELNDRTGGMKDGELTVFAAKASGGKTWFACASALAAVKAGVDTYFATLEMPVHQMLQRIEFLDSGKLSPLLYTRGARSAEDIAEMRATRERIASYPGRLVVDQPPAGERTISAIMRRCKSNGCSFAVIDQLQFVTRDSRYEKSYMALEKVMYDMKTEISAPADGKKVPLLLMHQFNREGVKAQGKDGLVGSMSQLAGSSVIEQVADTIWGLGSSLDGTRGRKTLAVLKGRRFPEFGFQMVWETESRARIDVDRDYSGRPVELEAW